MARVGSALAIFSAQAYLARPFLFRRAALAVLVPGLHGSTSTCSVRNHLCYNFLQPSAPDDRIVEETRRVPRGGGWFRARPSFEAEPGRDRSSDACAPRSLR